MTLNDLVEKKALNEVNLEEQEVNITFGILRATSIMNGCPPDV